MRADTHRAILAAAVSAAILFTAVAVVRAQQAARGGPDRRYDEGSGMRGSLDYYNPYAASKADPYESFQSRLPLAGTPLPATPVPRGPGVRAGVKHPASPHPRRPVPGTTGPGVRRTGSISSTQPLPRTMGETGYQITPPPSYPIGSNPYYEMDKSQPYYDEYGRVKYGSRELPNIDTKGVQQGRDWYKNMPYKDPRRGDDRYR